MIFAVESSDLHFSLANQEIDILAISTNQALAGVTHFVVFDKAADEQAAYAAGQTAEETEGGTIAHPGSITLAPDGVTLEARDKDGEIVATFAGRIVTV